MVEVNCETDFVARTDDFKTAGEGHRAAHRERRSSRGRQGRSSAGQGRASSVASPKSRRRRAASPTPSSRRWSKAKSRPTTRTTALVHQPWIREPKKSDRRPDQGSVGEGRREHSGSPVRPLPDGRGVEPALASARRTSEFCSRLSGEALAGGKGTGFDFDTLDRIAGEIKTVVEDGSRRRPRHRRRQHRPRRAVRRSMGMDRVGSDYMGMLGTVINALAMQDVLERAGVETRVMTAITHGSRSPSRSSAAARCATSRKAASCIFAGGTGNPYFSTDTAAALRAIQIQAAGHHQGDERRWRVFRRSQEGSGRNTLHDDQLPRCHGQGAGRDGPDGHRAVQGKQASGHRSEHQHTGAIAQRAAGRAHRDNRSMSTIPQIIEGLPRRRWRNRSRARSASLRRSAPERRRRACSTPCVSKRTGRSMPLNQVASVSAPEPRLLTVTPWDKGLITGDREGASRIGSRTQSADPVRESSAFRCHAQRRATQGAGESRSQARRGSANRDPARAH